MQKVFENPKTGSIRKPDNLDVWFSIGQIMLHGQPFKMKKEDIIAYLFILNDFSMIVV